MNSLKGKSTSEWDAWFIAYEFALKRKFDAAYVARLNLDMKALRSKCEAGINPIDLVKANYVPVVSARQVAVSVMEHRKILDLMEKERANRRANKVVGVCALISIMVVGYFGYLGIQNMDKADSIRQVEQDHVNWRKDNGFKN